MVRADPRSLRFRVLGVVVAVLLVPLVWIPTAFQMERRFKLPVQDSRLKAAAQAAASAPDLDAFARTEHVRLRVVGPDGQVLSDHDHNRLGPVPKPVSRMGGTPDARAFDAELGPLEDREIVVVARQGSVAASCEAAGSLLVCAAAQPLGDGRIAHVQRVSERYVSPLYEQRLSLIFVVLVVLVFGGLFALWIGVRMVRPMESLRDQVVARTRGRLSTEPIVLERNDELGELAVAFNRLLGALDARNRANEAFAADLAHELKNPVAAVRAAAEALERDMDPKRRERLRRVLQDCSRQMEGVVTRFLDLARAEAGLRGDVRQPLDLTALATALAEGMATPGGAGVTVRGPPAPVVAAPERLETALRNLLANALSFAGPQGRVEVTVRLEDGDVVLAVADSGPGIEAADLPRIFDRYYSRRHGGTGIGLALAHAIAEAHQGTLTATSPPGEGATFTLRLPCAR